VKPILSDLDALELERTWLLGELAAMKVLVLQAQYRDTRAALEARQVALARDGYRIDRAEDGTWSYTATDRPAAIARKDGAA
jgi:hypothetical protein